MSRFAEAYPSTESYWRSIILFGRNSASYKFALSAALLTLAQQGKTRISLEELAVPYASILTEHLRGAEIQGTAASSAFLAACRRYVGGEISYEQLVGETVARGFANVLDAFHVVNQADVPVRFFVDERLGRTPAITLTDEMLRLAHSVQFENLPRETEARWRLVETAWSLRVNANLLYVHHDDITDGLYVQRNGQRRVAVTSSRDALNGYQKGKCFYCFADISIEPGSRNLADVDHFFPFTLTQTGLRLDTNPRLDEIWNLVLACQRCNRGAKGKFARIPHVRYVERLHRRNEFLIQSHHPLRETLIRQSGLNEGTRAAFLQAQYNHAVERLNIGSRWEAEDEGEPAF